MTSQCYSSVSNIELSEAWLRYECYIIISCKCFNKSFSLAPTWCAASWRVHRHQDTYTVPPATYATCQRRIFPTTPPTGKRRGGQREWWSNEERRKIKDNDKRVQEQPSHSNVLISNSIDCSKDVKNNGNNVTSVTKEYQKADGVFAVIENKENSNHKPVTVFFVTNRFSAHHHCKIDGERKT